MRLILASSSPQRQKILKAMGLHFKAIPADIDEHHDGLRKPHAIARSIAERKAITIAEKFPEAWVIGCDTLVYLSNGDISVKPENRAHARQTLSLYRNSHCDVYSGLTLVNLSKNVKHSGFERTRIHFNDFPDHELESYLDSGDWEGRSGAMTIEDKAGWVRKMEGEYWNVVGLPVDLLKNYLLSEQLI